MGKRFAVIGVGGFVAPRHLKAIQDVGGEIVCALDPKDSVGIMDSYSKDVDFFTEFERFDRHCEKLRMGSNPIDYVSICSPNYLHDAHCRFALRIGATPICEKPLVIFPHNLDALKQRERQFSKKVYAILQLRYNPELLELKANIDANRGTHDVNLTYLTPRGKWYWQSWKGDREKSGGLLMNIGIHFVDLLIWLFGDLSSRVIDYGKHHIQLILRNEAVRINCNFSVSPVEKPIRSMCVDGKSINLTSGFENLHTECYKDIMEGGGHGIREVRPFLELVHEIYNGMNLKKD